MNATIIIARKNNSVPCKVIIYFPLILFYTAQMQARENKQYLKIKRYRMLAWQKIPARHVWVGVPETKVIVSYVFSFWKDSFKGYDKTIANVVKRNVH